MTNPEVNFSETQYAQQLSDLNDKLTKTKGDIAAIRSDIDAQLALATTHNYSTGELFDKYMAILNLKSEELNFLLDSFNEIKTLFDSSVQTIVTNEHRQCDELRQCEATLANLHATMADDISVTRQNLTTIRTEISSNVTRVNDAQSRFDAFLVIAKQLYSLYKPLVTPTPVSYTHLDVYKRHSIY